jgi:hypothetical protein
MENLFDFKNESVNENTKNVLLRLESVDIANYRAIEHLFIPMNDLGVVLSGLNGVGKTSVIEAIYFLLSGKLFDGRAKLGDQNITPTFAEKGAKTQIKAKFTNGVTFSGTFWEEWNDQGTIVKERKSVYEVNGAVVKQVKQAYQSLYMALGVADLINEFAKDPLLKLIDIIRLFYDIRYLKEIDYKELRALVIDMVGDIEYSTIIDAKENIYGRLKPYLTQSNGDLEAVKQRLRGEKFGTPSTPSGLEKQIDSIQYAIDSLSLQVKKDIDLNEIEIAKIELNTIENAIVDLKVKASSSKSQLIQDVENKIFAVKEEIAKKQRLVELEHNNIRESILAHNELELSKLKKFENEIANLRNEKISLNEKLQLEYNALHSINNNISNKEMQLKNNQQLLQTQENIRVDLVEQYKKESNPTSELITAPVSKERFHLHEALEYAEIRAKRIEQITQKGKEIKSKIEDVKGLIEQNRLAIQEYQEERNKQEQKVLSLQNAIKEIERKIDSITLAVEREKQNLDIRQVPQINYQTNELIDLNSQLNALQKEKQDILLNDQSTLTFETQIIELERKKEPLKEIINKLVAKEQTELQIENYRTTLAKTKQRLQEVNELLTLIKELEKEKFTLIDSMVQEKFGQNIKFKLFDYNITDESINTKLCDLLVRDGNGHFVNIKDINTGNYPIAALDFISRVKEHYGIGKSFIFIDEYGTVDENNRNAILKFGEQIIATEKGNSTKVEIHSI